MPGVSRSSEHGAEQRYVRLLPIRRPPALDTRLSLRHLCFLRTPASMEPSQPAPNTMLRRRFAHSLAEDSAELRPRR
jgi:hypothetical protein